ncbi:hypothetical protein BU26DRAFT_506291 [Trematosphaeria pertusa]|uniref:Uncharacterized protein n=1 Tax=Trematosphaeria pertusa TaxID=390896 RepID=A0A6A6I9C5_9PLEO|nr:uncharacterized protein BU26DRAFT_506291 [Trematosphaeria pertusa]KAF2246986.1 hypothetical protein BU26DRAFT_506291 [Trematosphaeria pertusa]
MAARAQPPPRTPSPKIRIYRSQSFDSPSSRVSVTPIDDSPYSKSTGAIAKPLPRYDAVHTAEQDVLGRSKVILQTKMSDDSLMSDASSASSSAASSPTSGSAEGPRFGLFSSSSPNLPLAPSPPLPHAQARSRPANINTVPAALPPPPEILSSSLSIYQDTSVPMYDPWLVRVVLDMYDVRGFDWTMIAEPIERIWGFRTSSAEVLGILSGNGRVGRRWWD